MCLILSHLNKFGFGKEPATAHCWLESDRHSLNRDLEEPARIGADRFLSVLYASRVVDIPLGNEKLQQLLNPKA